MKVSVVMTTYNGEKYISEQLESLCCQSISPDEIIIVDDNSMDNTFSILKKFEKEYPNINWKISKNRTNLGFRDNFKKGLNNATGDIIFLCDQDDIWSRSKIKLYMDFFKKNRECNILVSDFEYLFLENGIADRNATKIIKSKNNKITLTKRNYMNARPGWTFAFKKKVLPIFNQLSDKTIEVYHDEIIWYIGLMSGSLFYLPKKTGQWRRFSNSVTAIKIDETKMGKFRRMIFNRYQRSKDLLTILMFFDNCRLYNGTWPKILCFRIYIFLKILFFKTLLILRNEKK